MKKLLLLLLFIYIGQIQGQSWLWAKSGIGTGGDEGYSVAADSSGNVYITGGFQSASVTFGNYTLTNANPGYNNIFLVKYDAFGNVLWAKSAHGSNYDFGTSVVTDNFGNVYVSGYFLSSHVIFGTDTIFNAGNNDVFLAKYDSSGNFIWVRSAGGVADDENYSIATDIFGNIFMTGYFRSPTIIFGTDTLTNNSTNGDSDAFLAKYNTVGDVIWAKGFGGANYDVAYSVATDISSNVYITGYFSSSLITFGTFTLSNTNTGHMDIFIAKYNSSGTALWAKNPNGTSDEYAYSIATDLHSNAYITGTFAGHSVDFGTHIVTNPTLTFDVFLTKYDSSGNAIWAKSAIGDIGSDIGYDVTTDALDNVYLTGGYTSLSIAFDYDTLFYPPVTSAADPAFIFKFNSSGNVLCTSTLASGGDDNNGIAIDASGNAYFVSDFWISPFVVGSDTLKLDSLNEENIYVAKFTCSINNDIKKYEKNRQIKIYPNPAQNNFTIETISADKQTVLVYDVNGKQVLAQTINGTTNIDAGNFNAGVYNVSIIDNAGISNKRLVIVK
ncbi:MAG TPA: SBBP repeat-containing protein [Bacteroidia bacterium]|jgi:hypothetical protein|nr:SBBP repeat-containing protein [Bacteroidia bacterium]